MHKNNFKGIPTIDLKEQIENKTLQGFIENTACNFIILLYYVHLTTEKGELLFDTLKVIPKEIMGVFFYLLMRDILLIKRYLIKRYLIKRLT